MIKKIQNQCQIKFHQNSYDCQNCRYRHKGLCNLAFSWPSNFLNTKSINSEENLEIMSITNLSDSEPVLNLEKLFHKIKTVSSLSEPEPVINLEKLFHKIKAVSSLSEPEPVINLKNLFYEIKAKHTIKISAQNFPQKAKYDNFKLLTDIQRVLQKCSHLTDRDRLNYCNTQRYFMKLYLREINNSL
ncbi:MAG: hypothetical protein ACFFDB_07465 [Promethearchaeota archaeon]